MLYGGPEPSDRKRKPKGKCWMILVVICAMLCVQWVATSEISLLELLIPGESQVTISAVRELVDVLSEGESLGESVTAFCKQILAGEP